MTVFIVCVREVFRKHANDVLEAIFFREKDAEYFVNTHQHDKYYYQEMEIN